MSLRTRSIAGLLIALLGLATSFTEFGLYWYARMRLHEHYDINPWVLFGGAIVSFVGGFIIDSKKAEEATNVIVTSGVTILGALPFGRRWSDKFATAAATGAPTPPVPAQTPAPPPTATASSDPATPIPDLARIPAPEKGP